MRNEEQEDERTAAVLFCAAEDTYMLDETGNPFLFEILDEVYERNLYIHVEY